MGELEFMANQLYFSLHMKTFHICPESEHKLFLKSIPWRWR
jgi:hypothetical protein